MTNIVKIPKKENQFISLPRQRVFYIGYRYVGPFLCQDIQQLYLKRHGIHNGTRWWSMITYTKWAEWCKRPSVMELDKCKEIDLLDMLHEFDIDGDVMVSEEELKYMGWSGVKKQNAKILVFPNLKERIKEYF